ncbi:hypothetical protein [Candidatus Albibeggiatoa sp. nov. NOAA]|uniref:hypothetical protein n=1 Tax=Candidatus Albibeggiatoa sp. nov. NOAA TaxID=3162724 RepID=UPI0032F8D706|nr:hypothetical protein [Thiotrichaceae bacterium]
MKIDNTGISPPINAALYGFVADLAIKLLLFTIVLAIYSNISNGACLTSHFIDSIINDMYITLSVSSLLFFSIEFISSFVGGYVCAYLAKRNIYKYAFILWSLKIMLLLFGGSVFTNSSTLMQITVSFQTLLAVFIGAYIYQLSNEHDSKKTLDFNL